MSLRHFPLLMVMVFLLPPVITAADAYRGDRMLGAYFHRQVKEIADNCLADIKTKADWEKRRPELHRQFLDMLGLWPLPPRSDLKPVVTAKLDAEKFTVEKLQFQSRPGLYVTGNLYVPKNIKGRVPAVLYVCGHANTVVNGVSYGSKVNYQRHPTWFAEYGYVCLILDTLELAEIRGEHHGTYTRGMWWWQARGYTPAGVECWNAMRALDYLQSRPEVDPKRLGVTGRSGGGATSWWLAAADDRVQCIIPVAGIADLQAHLLEGIEPRLRQGVIAGHCDCMYMVNTYRWDFPEVAALCVPRPLMLGNSDADPIFPLPSIERLVAKVRKVYEMYGAADKFEVVITKGPHKDTPELRDAAFRWMNRWLKNETGPVSDLDRPPFTPQQLKVFDHLPTDAVNARIHETFVPEAHFDIPKVPAVARDWWAGKSKELLRDLKDRVFHGWPAQPPSLNAHAVVDDKHEGLRLRAYDFTSEEAVDLRLWLLTAEKVDKPKLVVLTAVDEPGWAEWTRTLGPTFKNALQLTTEPKRDDALFNQNKRALEFHQWAFATIAPRGIGPTRWIGSGTPADTHIRRRFPLLGQTLDGQRVWDVRRALAVLRGIDSLQGVPTWLQGKNEMAGIALYAALFEPEVARIDMWHPAASHRDGPIFLNVLKVLDMPQAIALAFPRQVRLYVRNDNEARRWDWALRLQKTLDKDGLQVRTVKE